MSQLPLKLIRMTCDLKYQHFKFLNPNKISARMTLKRKEREEVEAKLAT